jgi:DNA-directed RNA polymerase subunit omega
MKSDLVEKASLVIPHPPLLINMVSKRVRQLSGGRMPLVERRIGHGYADLALQEIIEGKVVLADPETGDIAEA